MNPTRSLLWLTLSWVVMATVPVLGQTTQPVTGHDLSKYLPGDALLYLGWAGSEAKVEGGPTAWSKLCQEPEVRAAIDTMWPRLEQSLFQLLAKEEGAETGAAAQQGWSLFKAFVKYPGALSIGGVAMSEEGPSFGAYLVIAAGEQSGELLKQVESLLAMAGLKADAFENVTVGGVELRQIAGHQLPVPLHWGVFNDCVILAVGPGATERLVTSLKGEGNTLAQNADFAAAMKNAGGSDGLLTGYFHVGSAIRALKSFIPMFAMMQVPVLGSTKQVDEILDQLGLSNAQAIAYTLRPESDGFMSRVFVYYPHFAESTTKPSAPKVIGPETFARVPMDANYAWAGSFDLARLYGVILNVVTAVDPDARKKLDRELGKIEELIGLKIHDDLLATLGTDWLIYDAPSHGGLWFSGITFQVSLRDANRFSESMEKLVGVLQDKAGKALKVEVETYRGQMIVYLNIIGYPVPVAPAWCIQGNRMIIALYPQMIRTAIDFQKDKLPSLADNSDFQRGWKLLPQKPYGVTYVNSAKGAGEVYSFALPIWQTVSAMAQKEGVEMNVSMLPSQRTITKHMFGTLSASALTDEGILCVSHGSLPFAVPSIGAGGNAATTAVMISIMLPSLARARELSKRAVSAANLRGVGVACMMYASNHDGMLPPDLNTLVKEGMLTPQALISPNDDSGGPSYQYVAGGLKHDDLDSRAAIAYEGRGLNRGEGGNVLFADGHVEFLKMPEYGRVISETNKRLRREKENVSTPDVKPAAREKKKKPARPATKPAVGDE